MASQVDYDPWMGTTLANHACTPCFPLHVFLSLRRAFERALGSRRMVVWLETASPWAASHLGGSTYSYGVPLQKGASEDALQLRRPGEPRRW